MNNNIVKARTCVYNVNYHVVWSVKDRNKVLTSEIEQRLIEILQQTASEKEFIVHQVQVGEQDHLHVFVSAHPKIAPSYIVKMMKGISARKLLMDYPDLKKKLGNGPLWNRSFYLETVGSVSEETIRQYIENQKKGE
jgi:putative transposase